MLKWGVNAQGFSQALRLNTLRTLRSWEGCFLCNLLRPTRGRHRETYLTFVLPFFSIISFPKTIISVQNSRIQQSKLRKSRIQQNKRRKTQILQNKAVEFTDPTKQNVKTWIHYNKLQNMPDPTKQS